ncbi:MAG: LysR family transcriptional regulator [Myxococcota bacterium]
MDIETLGTFIDVMRRGSFAAVARDRDVAPSSISRAIAGLEAELGLRLFQRTTRRLAPTEAGSLYYERVEPLVDELSRAHQQAVDVGEAPRGTLRATAPMSFAQRVLLPLLPALLERHPQLHVELVLTDAMVDLVAERVDVALRLGRLSDSDLVARRLDGFDFAVCAAPRYLQRHGRPRRPVDLQGHECLLFSMGGLRSQWRFRRREEIVEVQVRGRCVLNHALAIQRCAVQGLGVALLPRWAVAEEIDRGELVELLTTYEVTATDFQPAIWLLYPSRSYLPLKVRAFADFLEEHLRARPTKGPPGRRRRGR